MGQDLYGARKSGLRQWGYKGQDCNLSDEQWAEVEEELERKPYRYAKEVVAFVKERFGIEYSERGMQALLRRKGYRHTKFAWCPAKSMKTNSENNKNSSQVTSHSRRN
jgi:transposase